MSRRSRARRRHVMHSHLLAVQKMIRDWVAGGCQVRTTIATQVIVVDRSTGRALSDSGWQDRTIGDWRVA